MLKYLLGTDSGIQGDELGASDEVKPEEVEWQTAAIEGKLDLHGDAGFPHVQYLSLLRYCPADRHGMKKTI